MSKCDKEQIKCDKEQIKQQTADALVHFINETANGICGESSYTKIEAIKKVPFVTRTVLRIADIDLGAEKEDE